MIVNGLFEVKMEPKEFSLKSEVHSEELASFVFVGEVQLSKRRVDNAINAKIKKDCNFISK